MTLEDFSSILTSTSEITLVEFGVPSGCPRCEEISDSIDELPKGRNDWLTVRRMDLDQHPQLIWEFKLTTRPTYIAIRGGQEVFRATYPTSGKLIAAELDAFHRESSTDQFSLAVQ